MRFVPFSRLMTLAFAALCTVGGPMPSARAQMGTKTASVLVPFAFQEGNHVMPAGRYELQKQANSNFLLLRGDRDAINLLPQNEEGPVTLDRGKLVFHRIGDRYFLKQVWFAGSRSYLVLPTTKTERNEEIAAAAATRPNEQVAVLHQPR